MIRAFSKGRTYGYDAHSSLDAKLSTVLSNGSWSWKPARSYTFVEIHCRAMEVPLIDLSGLKQKQKNWRRRMVHVRGNSKEMQIIIWHKCCIKRGAAFLFLLFIVRCSLLMLLLNR